MKLVHAGKSRGKVKKAGEQRLRNNEKWALK